MAKPKVLVTDAEIATLRENVRAAMEPRKPSRKFDSYTYGNHRTDAGRTLPAHYLVYFLLVELLRFRDLGREEKVAWSIPVEMDGRPAFADHRKFGVGIFTTGTQEGEEATERIARLIRRGVDMAAPFFDHLAAQAASRSQLNVTNDSGWLFNRYDFLRTEFHKKIEEAEARKDEREVEEIKGEDGKVRGHSYGFPAFTLRQEAAWLGVSAVEAFFSWTEHVFIHLAILQGKVTTGDDVAALAAADWKVKAQAALDLNEVELKRHYDDLLTIRKQIRNFIAHGAFGKSGEAFQFHSRAGAVPLTLTDHWGRYSMFGGKLFDEVSAIATAEAFVTALWSGKLAPAKIYIQESSLPVILTYASDGTYRDAMTSVDSMEEFSYGLGRVMDDHANMDW